MTTAVARNSELAPAIDLSSTSLTVGVSVASEPSFSSASFSTLRGGLDAEQGGAQVSLAFELNSKGTLMAASSISADSSVLVFGDNSHTTICIVDHSAGKITDQHAIPADFVMTRPAQGPGVMFSGDGVSAMYLPTEGGKLKVVNAPSSDNSFTDALAMAV